MSNNTAPEDLDGPGYPSSYRSESDEDDGKSIDIEPVYPGSLQLSVIRISLSLSILLVSLDRTILAPAM
jgi:hypothetical protein